MSKRSAKDKVLAYIKKYPNAKVQSAANAASCSYNNAWTVMNNAQKARAKGLPLDYEVEAKPVPTPPPAMTNGSTYEAHAPKTLEVADSPKKKRNRGDVLCEAQSLVMTERNKDYGDPYENHANIAELASLITGKELTAHDITIIQIATKLSRLRTSPDKFDHYVDIAGYSAVAYECLEDE